MNHLAEVGRVTPCAPFFALSGSVVAAVGAQRTARPTVRFLESLLEFTIAHWDQEPDFAPHNVLPTSRRQRSPFCRQDAGNTLRFMKSLHGSATAHWDHEPPRIPLTRPSDTLSPSGGEGWGEGVRVKEGFCEF